MLTTKANSHLEAEEATDHESLAPQFAPELSPDSRLKWIVIAALTVLVIVGLAFRTSSLAAIGFAEDEVNKVEAVRRTAAATSPPMLNIRC